MFEKYIPKFEYELVDLNNYEAQDIARFGNALSLIMLIDKIQTTDGLRILRDLPKDYIDKLKETIPPHLNKLLADVITVFLTRINVPAEEIEDVATRLYERRISDMFDFIDNYDVQETRRIARAEGMAEGEIERTRHIARKLLAAGVPMDIIIASTGLTNAEIEQLRSAK